MSIGYSWVLMAAACGLASAQNWTPMDVKTGVWESTTTNQMSGVPPIPQSMLDKMSPDQRAKMEAAMKGQNAKTTTHRSCLKKEDLNRPLFQDNKNCKETLVSGTASRREVHIECDSPAGKADGTVRIEALNSENVKITTQLKMSGDANSMSLNSTTNAKWISAVCTGKED